MSRQTRHGGLQVRQKPDRAVWRTSGSRTLFDRPLRMESLEDRRLLATFTVVNLNDAGPGSLRQAILDANAAPGADEIVMPTLVGEIHLTSGELVITDSVTITGTSAHVLAIHQDTPNSRVFNIDDGNSAADKAVMIKRITITGGGFENSSPTPGGGGIRSWENLTLTECAVRDNAIFSNSSKGAGIYQLGGHLVIEASLIANNDLIPQGGPQSNSGGGIYLASGQLTIHGSTIRGSQATDGGGIAVNGSATISNSTIESNAATYGGGVSHNQGNLTITGSTFHNNGAIQGGGLLSETSAGMQTTIENSTFSDNRVFSGGVGGGIFNGFGTMVIRHSTITDNTAPANAGGGVASRVAGTTVSVYSTIIAKNVMGGDVQFVDGGANSFTSLGYNLVGTGNATGAFGAAGDQVGVDPLLGPLSSHGGGTLTHALLPGSPAIDMGKPTFAAPPTNDQRGGPFVRVAGGGRIDIGAYERQTISSSTVVTTLKDEFNGLNVGDGNSLREVLFAAAPGATITFAVAGTIDLTDLGALLVNKSVNIVGPGAHLLTIEPYVSHSDNGSASGFFVSDASTAVDIPVTISGLSITGAKGPYLDGGAIASREDLTIEDCVIFGNEARDGGGIFASGGSTTIVSSIIANNLIRETLSGITRGGGIDVRVGELTIIDSIVSGNQSGVVPTGDLSAGAGIAAHDGLTLLRTVVANNRCVGPIGWGGGIFSKGPATITDSIIEGNSAQYGGGILGTNVAITNSTIRYNSATKIGGGVRVWGYGTDFDPSLSVVGSNIRSNSAEYGGGIRAIGSVTIANSTISANLATRDGGGILAGELSFNQTPTPATMTIVNSTISGNTAVSFAGGVFNFAGNTEIRHSTITQNTSQLASGGSGVASRGNGTATTLVASSIIAGNSQSGGDVQFVLGAGNSFISSGYNLIGGGNALANFNQAGDRTSVGNPGLAPLANNGGPTLTHALLPTSLAMDAGDPSVAANPLQFDQRGTGFVRVADSNGDGVARIDVGAFERQPMTFVVDTAVDENDGNHLPGDLSLREAIVLANANPGADVITFAQALSGAKITLGGTALAINGPLSINAVPLAADVTIDANQASRVFEITGVIGETGYVTLAGLTMTGGRTTGGGFESQGGGAIRAITSDLQVALVESTVRDNTVTGNAAAGGGIFVTGAVALVRSTVSGNRTMGSNGNGGGIRASTAIITDSTISGNSTAGTSALGGGMIVGDVTLLRSTVSGNSTASSGANGGGIWSFGSVTIDQSTVTENRALQASGGGVFQDTFGNLPISVSGSIVSANTAASGGADVVKDVLATLTVNFSLIGATVAPDAGGSNVFTNAPLLGSLAANGGPTRTHAPQPGSPAINAGNPALAFDPSQFDQRGAPYVRVSEGRIDIGAFEQQPLAPTGDFDNDTDVDGFDFLIWQRGFGATGALATRANGNADGDGDVDGADLGVWRSQFGTSRGGVATLAPSSQAASSAALTAARYATAADAIFASGEFGGPWSGGEGFLRGKRRGWRR